MNETSGIAIFAFLMVLFQSSQIDELQTRIDKLENVVKIIRVKNMVKS